MFLFVCPAARAAAAPRTKGVVPRGRAAPADSAAAADCVSSSSGRCAKRSAMRRLGGRSWAGAERLAAGSASSAAAACGGADPFLRRLIDSCAVRGTSRRRRQRWQRRRHPLGWVDWLLLIDGVVTGRQLGRLLLLGGGGRCAVRQDGRPRRCCIPAVAAPHRHQQRQWRP